MVKHCGFWPVIEPSACASIFVASEPIVAVSTQGAAQERNIECLSRLASALVSVGAPVPCVPLYVSEVDRPVPEVTPEPMSTVVPVDVMTAADIRRATRPLRN